METILYTETETVRIGPEHPFVIIGERINPTGRPGMIEELNAGKFDIVKAEAVAQVEAGAQMLDINAGIPTADEPALLAEVVKAVQSVVTVPLVLDSANPDALEAALKVYQGKALVNSVTGEDAKLKRILPKIAEYQAAVIGISNDDEGISEDPDMRIKVARKIIAHAEEHGIAREDVIIDPIIMPIGARSNAAVNAFTVVRRCQNELGVNTCCGASNISFGMPNRTHLNTVFLSMIMAAGMPCAITNPTNERIRMTVFAADLMLGRDERHTRWVNANHSINKPATETSA